MDAKLDVELECYGLWEKTTTPERLEHNQQKDDKNKWKEEQMKRGTGDLG